MRLVDYNEINRQAEAVLAYVRYEIGDGIDPSWDYEQKDYLAVPMVNEWVNGREKGYVITMTDKFWNKQINIVFYEHRNTDLICALMWENNRFGIPSIQDAIDFGHFNSSSDYTHSVSVGRADEMAAWIKDQLYRFWVENSDA